MDFDIHTLKNLEKAIDKSFGNKEAHIYYSDDLELAMPQVRDLEKKELPGFSIIFSKNMSKHFIISGTELPDIKFNDQYAGNEVVQYAGNEVVSLMKLSVIQNPIYFSNNHVPIYINNPEQKKYVDAIKQRFSIVKEYFDNEI